MHAAVRTRHYGRRTEKAYLGWIRRFISFNRGRDPRELGADQVKEFLSRLAVNGHVSASTQNQAFSALLFLYREVLGAKLQGLETTERAKRPERLPQVLSTGEVRAVLRHLRGRMLTMAFLMYGAGLRLLECARLRVKDIDFERFEITVRDGKGRKDRVTVLPARAAARLRAHLEKVRRVLGSPFRSEIERRDSSALDRALNAVTEALRPWDGKDAPISAHVLTAA